MRYSDISNDDDTIDSRDVEKRIDELESERADLESMDDVEKSLDERFKEWDESDEGQELKHLTALRDDLEGYCPDWRHGVTLIRESYWVEYCKEYIKDVYSLREVPDILKDNINWEGVAEDLQQDFTSGDFDGVTYWAR